MTVPCCPRCGDQTLWVANRNRQGELNGFCRFCGHKWPIVERNVFRCDDPEGQWIKDQEEATK